MPDVTLRLTIDVTYQGAEGCQPELENLLHDAATHLETEGMLSGFSAAWVTKASVKVERILPPQNRDAQWKTVCEHLVRLIYRCPQCGQEYGIEPGEASIPYCTNNQCRNVEGETDFDRMEMKTDD